MASCDHDLKSDQSICTCHSCCKTSIPCLKKNLLFFLSATMSTRSNGGRRADSPRNISVCLDLIYMRKICHLLLASFASASARPFLLRRIWDSLTSSKSSCSLRNTSIYVAKVGQSIGFVVISTRSEQSVSNLIKDILLSLIHAAAQSNLSISACKAERLMLHARNPKISEPIWSLRLHPKPLTLPLLIHDKSIWHVGVRGI